MQDESFELVATLGVILLFLAVFAVGIFASQPARYETKVHVIQFDQKVQDAIAVAGLTNQFEHVYHVGFGGAGAGGMGTAEVTIASADQFVRLVPKGEKIYTVVGYKSIPGRGEIRTVVEKRYWAFIENRSGVYIYTESYQHNGWFAESFTAEKATFTETVPVWE